MEIASRPSSPKQLSGERRTQEFFLGGGVVGNRTEDAMRPFDLSVGENLYIDQTLGAVVRRDGATATALPNPTDPLVPIAVGEWRPGTSTDSRPLALFSTASSKKFYKYTDGAWSEAAPTANMYADLLTNAPGSTAMGPGSHLYVAASTLLKWDGANLLCKHGLPQPFFSPFDLAPYVSIPTPPPAGYTLVGGAGVAIDTRSFACTFYDSVTGLESDFSNNGTIRQYRFKWTKASSPALWQFGMAIRLYPQSTITGTTPHMRLYQWEGGAYRLVKTVNLTPGSDTPIDLVEVGPVLSNADPNSTFYDNTTWSQFLGLGVDGGARGQRANLNVSTTIIAPYSAYLWAVDASNPRILRRSDAYTGSNNNLEYWPAQNYISFPEPITGLLNTPGKLLVFHERNISYLSGRSPIDFQLGTYRVGVGTRFHSSISTDGQHIICLDSSGWVDITAEKAQIDAPIRDNFAPLLRTAPAANTVTYASSAFNPRLNQFICLASTPQSTSRNQIWGWCPQYSDPENQRWIRHTFAFLPDSDTSGRYGCFLFHPSISGPTLAPQQPATFLLYKDATAGKVARLLDPTTSTDLGSAFTSLVVTGRLAPGDPSMGKLITHLQFPTAYVDPRTTGTCTLQYLVDFDEPHKRNYASSLIAIPADASEAKVLPQGRCHFIHLVVTDTSTDIANKLLLSRFILHYRERRRREAR